MAETTVSLHTYGQLGLAAALHLVRDLCQLRVCVAGIYSLQLAHVMTPSL